MSSSSCPFRMQRHFPKYDHIIHICMHNKVQQLQSDMHRPHSGSEAGKDTVDFPVAVFHSLAVLSALAVSIRVPYITQNIRHRHTYTHKHTDNIQIEHTVGTSTYTYGRGRQRQRTLLLNLILFTPPSWPTRTSSHCQLTVE